MLNLIFITIFASLLTWAMMDIYFYSVVFAPIRELGEQTPVIDSRRKCNRLQAVMSWLSAHFQYMLNCPFCISHWFSAIAVLVIRFDLCFLKSEPLSGITPLSVLILIPIVARIANVLRDYTIPPITNDVLNNVFYGDAQNDDDESKPIPHDSPAADTSGDDPISF